MTDRYGNPLEKGTLVQVQLMGDHPNQPRTFRYGHVTEIYESFDAMSVDDFFNPGALPTIALRDNVSRGIGFEEERGTRRW